ncbi:MAG: ribonuclease P protein component [Candidatus Saccharibacteria bacterium]
MLARQHRLRKNSDILRLYKKGRRAHTQHLLGYSLATHLPVSRAVVVISKKVDKRAVVRNRCRRRVSESLRLELPKLATGFDILITIKTDIREQSAVNLKQEISQLITKLGVKGL